MNLEKLVTSKWFLFFNWLWNLFVLNIVLIFMLFGIITFFPAIVSLFLTFDNLKEKPTRFCLKCFFINFKNTFKKTVLPGLFNLEFIFLFLYSLFLYKLLLDKNYNPVLYIGFYFIFFIFFLLIIIITNSGLIMAKLNVSFFDSLKLSFYFSFRYIYRSFIILPFLVISILVFYFIMPLWFFMGLSLGLFMFYLTNQHIFEVILRSKEEEKICNTESTN